MEIPGLYDIPMPVIPLPKQEPESESDSTDSADSTGSTDSTDSTESELESEVEVGSDFTSESDSDIEGGFRRPPAYTSVAERTAALLREYEDLVTKPRGEEEGDEEENERKQAFGGNISSRSYGSNTGYTKTGIAGGTATGSGDGGQQQDESPKAKLAALKSLLGKPHVYGVADKAFR